ncbi:DNA-binding transcriptional LysR family regulator [Stackebrandtia albiflava]|uniref:DNA-binding transcriptional LysR family regulator n=1 Tax=Stackebrandtia albiflava TaxID=406432 RepID=A0A562VDJ4_9ACTN|nr:LysR family transcriptional regulator [Stackebrandtia albiflava]TWJ15928.1 DNA-binding transcriptional LysR family regulator [Stackebrandtia albiflava]
MDVDIRLLRYFAAVAQEGNLTRAAQRLYVSQPALTRQIRQLENRLGMTLFTRSRSGMALTAPGRVLARRVVDWLAEWDDILGESRTVAASEARVLRVGAIASAANEATRGVVAAFRRRRPGWRVAMRQAGWGDPSAGLAGGEVDVALLRLPFPGDEDYRTLRLFAEDRYVALPQDHPLAGEGGVPFRELWEQPFVAAPAHTGRWRDWWLATDARRGRPVTVGAVTEQPEEWLDAIADGYGIALAPRSASRFYARPGVVYRPVTGVAPSVVAVAWRAEADADPVVRDFVACCRAAAGTRRDSTA